MPNESDLGTLPTHEPSRQDRRGLPPCLAARRDRCRARRLSRTGEPASMVSVPTMRTPLERRATDLGAALAFPCRRRRIVPIFRAGEF